MEKVPVRAFSWWKTPTRYCETFASLNLNLSPMQAALAQSPGPVCEMCSQFVTDLRTWLQSEDGSDQVTATLEQVGRGSAGMILTVRVTNDPLVLVSISRLLTVGSMPV